MLPTMDMVMVMLLLRKTAQSVMSPKLLKLAHQQLKQSVMILNCPSKLLLMLNNVIKSPVLYAQSLSQKFPKKSVFTNTLRNTKRLLPKLLRSTMLKKPMYKWSLSAVVHTVVTDTMPLCTMPLSTTPPTMGSITTEPTLDTPHTLLARGRPRLRLAQRLNPMLKGQNVMLKDMVMEVMANTAKRLLKKLPTMYLYLPQLISRSRFPTLFPKRFALTNPSYFPWSHVMISFQPNASKYLQLLIAPSKLPHAKPNWEPPLVQTMSSAYPNNAVLHLFTDMLNMSHQDIITKHFKS